MSRRTQDTSRAFNSVVYRTITSYGRSFQIVPLPLFVSYRSPTTPDKSGLGSSPFARRYLGNRFFFLFLWVLRCFSSPGLPLLKLCIHLRVTSIDVGFPHSDIFGSTLTYSSPKHFGVCSVLHRLLVPRHPPCALTHLHSQNNLKMLASTVQFSNNTHQPHPHPNQTIRAYRESVPSETTKPPQGLDGVVSDTQQCVSSEPHSPASQP